MIYYQIIRADLFQKYKLILEGKTKPFILKYIKQQITLKEMKAYIRNENSKLIAIDLFNNLPELNNNDVKEVIKSLELDTFLINKIKKKADIKYFKKLVNMNIPSAYDIFLQYTESDDIDIKYTCFFGLIALEVEQEKKLHIIKKLLISNIFSDRIIEMLSRQKLNILDLLSLLYQEENEIGKIIILKVLAAKKEIQNPEIADKLLKFLNETKEVRIAAVTALCNSKNEDYVEKLFILYLKDTYWEVRAAIAKGMVNFNFMIIKDKLLFMMKDKEWWVRYNAARTLSFMGEDGVFALIDLSIMNDDKISALAYYFLNSNKEIYEIVKNIEG
jgi:hypothetical protein